MISQKIELCGFCVNCILHDIIDCISRANCSQRMREENHSENSCLRCGCKRWVFYIVFFIVNHFSLINVLNLCCDILKVIFYKVSYFLIFSYLLEARAKSTSVVAAYVLNYAIYYSCRKLNAPKGQGGYYYVNCLAIKKNVKYISMTPISQTIHFVLWDTLSTFLFYYSFNDRWHRWWIWYLSFKSFKKACKLFAFPNLKHWHVIN